MENRKELIKLELSISIDATREKVWNSLLDHYSYRVRSSNPNGGFNQAWSLNKCVTTQSPTGEVLISRVVQHVPFDIITIEHLGIMNDGTADFESEEALGWKGINESYWLMLRDGKTLLVVEQECPENYGKWFGHILKNWLTKIKRTAELSNNSLKFLRDVCSDTIYHQVG